MSRANAIPLLFCVALPLMSACAPGASSGLAQVMRGDHEMVECLVLSGMNAGHLDMLSRSACYASTGIETGAPLTGAYPRDPAIAARPAPRVGGAKVDAPADTRRTGAPAATGGRQIAIEIPASIATDVVETTIEGRVRGTMSIAQLEVDGTPADVGPNGRFSATVHTPIGRTIVPVVAVDRQGARATAVVEINRRQPATGVPRNDLPPLVPPSVAVRPNPNRVAVIVGVSRYGYMPEAEFADRDANAFRDFATVTLGIAEDRILLLTNDAATRTEVMLALRSWLAAHSEPDTSEVFVFFAGHGIASNDGEALHLLLADTSPSLLEQTAIAEGTLVREIQSHQPRSITLFIDACFSGVGRDGEVLVETARGIRPTAKPRSYGGNVRIFAAAQNDQIALGARSVGHGLFSYFLMRGLAGASDADRNGTVTWSELERYVVDAVSRTAAARNVQQRPFAQIRTPDEPVAGLR